ncbi:unnamed protein product [Adineta steineri]|uniref:GAR domain-containing protein n=1 Tax=Adineta steineri TaxID=433720 RepID=A0A818N5C2_9BILA|nr:unnamed protein product [Adineta steineri]
MERSLSMSSDNYQHLNKSSASSTSRSIPIRLVTDKNTDYYSSDTDAHHPINLQRTSSTSSFCSTSSTGSASYRILPVRYSSVDRVVQKPAIISANKRGINVRIRFERPRYHSHHHHHQHHRDHQHTEEHERRYHREHREEHEHRYERHSTKQHEQYSSCPTLNKNLETSNTTVSNRRYPSNINYIATRSVVRGYSSEQLNNNNHSTTLIIRRQSLPSITPVAHTRIKHIPLDTHSLFKPIITHDFENDLLSQASRIKDIRNIVRQDFISSSHQELRSSVNQASDHAQDLFTISKNYSEKLDIVDTALSLVTDLTSHIIELETRLASYTPLFDDETHIHRQLAELNELNNRSQSLEKSIKELLTQSQQLGNEKLNRTSEQLISRWKQINSEINQRKRSITQCLDTYRSFKTVYEQEEHKLDGLQRRVETLEPVSNDTNKLRFMGKTVSDLFNEILSRAQSIEHMNDIAVKFVEETKMHDNSLKRFRVSLRELHPSLDATVSITRRQQYPSDTQRASRSILHKIEAFDRRYADLLSKMEEYSRSFAKAYTTTGQTINLPLDSASAIVHLYRSTIASRYNITLQSLVSSDDDEAQSSLSSSSTKPNRHNNNNKTGSIELSRGKVTVDHHHHYHHHHLHNPLSPSDTPVSLETTYVIPTTENDLSNNKKVRFIVQKQPASSSTSSNGNIIISTTKTNEMTQRKTLSFVDAVNNKHLDLSTGLFSSPLPFALSSSSSSFSSSTLSSDQHRHPHTHFSSSSSTPHTTISTNDNKNLATSSSSLSVNNHHHPVGADTQTNTTAAAISLKEAIDTNILDAQSAYVVDTLEQRNYDLRSAYSRGLITSNNHRIVDRAKDKQLTLADALKMGILKVGDPQCYNIISKTESLVISSVYDHRANTYIDPNNAIRKRILDPYHGLYLNNLTQETISIDDAMNKNLIIVEQQSSKNQHQPPNDKYVISTSLIRETRSYHLLGVRDYVNNKELTVQEAIRLGILDKQNGQYINKKTNQIFSISEAIAQGHIRAQPLPVESLGSAATGASSSVTTTTTAGANTNETIGTQNIKRGTVKETKTYTLKSAIHPRTNKEIPIRQAIDEGIIDHAKGFYVNSITGENLPISVAIEKGLIFTELIDQNHSKRCIKTLIIEQVIDPITNARLGVTEAIQTGLLNSTITSYYHSVKQRQMTIHEAYDQGLIIGKFVDQKPSSFIGSQQQQTFYAITKVVDIRNDRVYNLQEGIDQRLLDHRKGVYIHPLTGDEIFIGDAVKRGFVQVQAVSSQISDQISSSSAHSNVSIRIDSHPQSSSTTRPTSQGLRRETEIIEIETIPGAPRHRRHHHRRTEEEIIEQHTTNIVNKEVIKVRGRSNERPQPTKQIEEVIIDDRQNKYRPGTIDIKEDREYVHEEVHIETERHKPPPPPPHREKIIIDETHREQHEVHIIPPPRPQPPVPPRPSTTIVKEDFTKIEIDHRPTKPTSQRPDEQHQQQSWSEDEWEQWHCTMMIKDKPYRVVWVMNTATGDRLPLQNAYQSGLVDTKQRLFFDQKLNRQAHSFEKAVELGYMGVEPDTASLPIRVDGIDYMIHWVLDSSTKRRIFPRQAITKQILDAKHGRYVNPFNNSQVSLHEAIHLKFIGATEYGSTTDSITVTLNGQTYNIKWVYDTRNMKKILPRDALRQGILDIQLNEYRKFDTNDVMTIFDAIQAGYIKCNDDDSSSDNSIRPPSIISVDEDELTIATKTATYVITSVIHPLTQKEIKVSEAIDLGILDKETGSYRDLVTNAQYELAEAINEGLVYATIIETKEDTEMMTSSLQEIIKKFIVKSVAVDSDSHEKIGGLEAQAVGILNYAQGIYHDRKYGVKIPLDKAIEKRLLDVELVSQKKNEEYDLELITDTITEKRITLYKIHGVQNNVLGRMESGAIAIKNQMIDTEAKTFTDFSTGETMSIQEAVNRNLIQAEISEHVERKPLGLSMQNAIRLGFYVAETGTFRDPATEHYMSLMEAIERGHIHVNGVAFADSEQGPITLYDAFSLGLINRRDGGKLNQAKMNLYRARLVESKLHRMNVEDAIRCGLLNLRTGSYKHPHSGEQLNLKEAIQRGLIDGQSTVIENPSTGRFMTLKEALDGIRIDNEGQVVDSYSNKIITTLELAYNHRKLFSQFDVNAGEIFLPSQNESVGFEKAVRKNLLDNNRIKLFDPKSSREYSIQDAIERGLIDHESGLIYDSHSRTTYSIREAIRHGIIAVVGAPLVPIKADHETVAAKITSRNRRRHSLAKSSLHFDYNSAPDSADEDSHGSGGWHRIAAKNRAISPISANGKRSIRRRTGSSPSRNNNRISCRDDGLRTGWRGGNNDDDDDDDNNNDRFTDGSRRTSGNNTYYSSTTTSNTRSKDNNDSSNRYQSGGSSSGFQQNQQNLSNFPTVNAKDSSQTSYKKNNDNNGKINELLEHKSEMSYYVPPATHVSREPLSTSPKIQNFSDEDDDLSHSSISKHFVEKNQYSVPKFIADKDQKQNVADLPHSSISKPLTENYQEEKFGDLSHSFVPKFVAGTNQQENVADSSHSPISKFSTGKNQDEKVGDFVQSSVPKFTSETQQKEKIINLPYPSASKPFVGTNQDEKTTSSYPSVSKITIEKYQQENVIDQPQYSTSRIFVGTNQDANFGEPFHSSVPKSTVEKSQQEKFADLVPSLSSKPFAGTNQEEKLGHPSHSTVPKTTTETDRQENIFNLPYSSASKPFVGTNQDENVDEPLYSSVSKSAVEKNQQEKFGHPSHSTVLKFTTETNQQEKDADSSYSPISKFVVGKNQDEKTTTSSHPSVSKSTTDIDQQGKVIDQPHYSTSRIFVGTNQEEKFAEPLHSSVPKFTVEKNQEGKVADLQQPSSSKPFAGTSQVEKIDHPSHSPVLKLTAETSQPENVTSVPYSPSSKPFVGTHENEIFGHPLRPSVPKFTPERDQEENDADLSHSPLSKFVIGKNQDEKITTSSHPSVSKFTTEKDQEENDADLSHSPTSKFVVGKNQDEKITSSSHPSVPRFTSEKDQEENDADLSHSPISKFVVGRNQDEQVGHPSHYSVPKFTSDTDHQENVTDLSYSSTSKSFLEKNLDDDSLYSSVPKSTTENDQSEKLINIPYSSFSRPVLEQHQDEKVPDSSHSSIPKYQEEKEVDHSSKYEATEQLSQNDDNQVILDMHDVASRLTSLHDQLNQYVYLTDNLNELRTNVDQIKTLHSDVEQEKRTINNLVERASHINPQLANLSQDLEEKRVEISDINSGLSEIIDRFISQVDEFNNEHDQLNQWIETNNKEIQKPLELSTLESDNKQFKTILNTTINLQNDVKSLQDQLQSIDSTIQDFEEATGNTDGGKSANIYKQLQQRADVLTTNYTDFLKRSKQISDQCERHMITYNEINHLNEQILTSMNEFNENLTSDENKQQDDNTLQVLLLNVQQQLDKLNVLATHEPASPSPVMSTSTHLQNEMKEHLHTLIDSHSQRYDNAQQGLMHNFELLERYNHERQTIKERIEELNHWLFTYTDNQINSNAIFSKPLSLKRSKLDEQIIQFRQFHAQLRTRRHSFDSDINTTINLEQLLDNNDKNNLEYIDKQFQLLDDQANQYNERINRLSTRLNEFHLEHVHLIDNYSKRLRLYSEHIEQNDDINFSALQLLLNNDNEIIIDHDLYDQLIEDLTETDNIEDINEIIQYKTQVNNYKNQYDKFQNDLKLILSNRQDILNEYELKKNFVQEWLLTTDRLLKQYPNELTLSLCKKLLNEHSTMPIEEFKLLNQQLINFYSSPNLLNLYEQLKLTKHINKHSNITKNFQRQTDELIDNYNSIKDRILQHMNLLENIQQDTEKYQVAKQKAEDSIEKAKELVKLEENTILPLDHQQLDIMLQKYKSIADQFKMMSPTIDEFKTRGLTLINTAERYIDTEPIQNEITSIDKAWSEYVEYILDTLDYIQLHQEDLHEFHQLSNDLISSLNEKQHDLEILSENDLKSFNNDLEKCYEQVELLNQKGELLLQSSATNLNDENDNQIERLLEAINRNYDSLTVKTKSNLENTDHTQQSTMIPTEEQEEEEQNIISPILTNQLSNELQHHIEETDIAMNELSELLVSSTTDAVSAQPIKLSEQLLDNIAVQSELERRKIALEQLHSNVETLKQMMANSPDTDSVKVLDQRLTLLNEHWSIMKQANDIRTENLLLTQACATTFWSQHSELSTFLNNTEKQLTKIRPRSTSREHIQRESQKYNQLANDFSNEKIKFQEILEQHTSQLLTLIANNPEESNDIERNIQELKQEWNRIETNLNTCHNELQQAMIESTEFNSKLERVSTWFDDTAIPSIVNDNNEFERIRTFKEHLDCKYLDIVNLKQDYTDIEQHKQQRIDGTIQQDEHDMEENEKTNLVEEQLVNIDSKWVELNGKIQEHKTLVYETALRQNRVGDVISDINHSLDDCSSKLSVLIGSASITNLNDMKQTELSIAKLRILLNDIELLSYDIEQLKQSSTEDQNIITIINNQWEELLKKATDNYNYLETKLEQMKLKQKAIDHIYHELDLIDKQVNESSINTRFPLLIERLEYIEEEINKEFSNDSDNQQIIDLKKRLIDVKQRALTKGQELIELAHSIELFHSSLQKFTEWLTETERYLNHQKPVQRRFGLIQTLLKQIDDHKHFQIQLQTYKEHLIDLDKLATHLKFVSPKNDSIYIRNSLTAAQTRWQKVLTRTTERTKELQKAFHDAKKNIRPEVTDIDRIKSEVNRQASLCTCSKKYDVQQIAEGRYRFGESQSLRLVRILRSTVMVRVGGGWTALDEFLVRHDPCRAKGRTNYELHPESYALRDGVAQTMTLFKPRLVTVHRPTCLYHQQQLAAASATSKQSPGVTPNRGSKDKSRRTSSINSFLQQQQPNSSFGDLSASGDDLSTSPHVLSDSEARPSHIPILVPSTTPGASTLSRTSSRESVLSEQSIASTSSAQQRRPSKLPLPVIRQKKTSNGTSPAKNT